MTPRRRWSIVALVAVALVVVPAALPAWPAKSSTISAAGLRRAIGASASVGWSGEVRTRGSLHVPDTDSFGGVARLLGEERTLRVWWRSPIHWRVDHIRQTGEADLVRDGGRITSWVFESRTATVSPYSDVRLPDDSDLLPPRLARRLLAGASDDELSRLPTRQIDGRDAPGLRFEPGDRRSTIRHLDVWADPKSGLPMRVEVFGPGSGPPVVTTRFVHVDLSRPTSRSTTFLPAPGAKLRSRDSLDVAAAANVFAPFELPASLAGLERKKATAGLGATGVYGRGPTSVLVVPLRRRLAGQVRDQLSTASDANDTADGTSLEVGPLSVLLTPGRRGRGSFLLAGSVTPPTLATAANELRSGVRVR